MQELIKMPHAEIMDMAKLFAESGMFPDMKTMGMAFVKIQAGKEIGISPFAAMTGIHIIQGKATIGAGLMAGCVKGSPKYDYKVVVMDDKICTINFTTKQGALLGTSTFTIDDAKKAQTKNLDKFPKNMLFARAMSNGVKWFTPDVFTMPVYTPEDFNVITEDVQHTDVTQPAATSIPATIITKKKLSLANYNAALAKLENGIGTAQALKDTFDLTDIQLAGIEVAEKKGEELKSAIDSLPIATTPDELTQLKDQLPAYIVSNAAFETECGKRLEVIMAAQA